ncbi:MAG: helix-hairpin-helix domain-containing protein [Oscillospiraceae bacterium]|nr:helix-hairpin-helix domain-containing protein [Oscillospiraceae bacterium]
MTDLTKIPGIGVKMAQHFVNIGYPDIASLRGQDPDDIYMKHCLRHGDGNMSCRCVLYCYRLAVHYANNDGQLPPDKQNWSDWKD